MIGILNLRAGDVVEVKSEAEILATLDENRMLEGVPFMPEMVKFSGRRFRVFKRADKVCVEGAFIRRMRNAVFLESVRCDGEAHEGCRRLCMIFWKEAWLKRAAPYEEAEPPVDWMRNLPGEVATPVDHQVFSCQSTSLLNATEDLSGWDPRQYVRDLVSGNNTLYEVVRAFLVSLYNMAARVLRKPEFGAAVGRATKTPQVSLNLRPGELVEVKSREEILATVDANGRNRGLSVDYEMLRHCGRRYRVLTRVDRIILEGSGRMREIRDSVILDQVGCIGICRRGCARNSHPFWREAWLRRVES